MSFARALFLVLPNCRIISAEVFEGRRFRV